MPSSEGLEVASEKKYTEVEAKGDSQLVVKQVHDEWNVTELELRILRDRVRELAEEFEHFERQHISRGENGEADELVKIGLISYEVNMGNTLCTSIIAYSIMLSNKFRNDSVSTTISKPTVSLLRK